MATKLILIRHGQTNWNLKRSYSGFLDVSLNKNGKIQAQKLCKRLKREDVHRVYSSDRKRAVQTAKIIFKGAEIEKIPDLREVHFGIFEGLTYKEIMKKHPVIYKRWLKDPFSITIPKGESLNYFKRRIIRSLKKIIASNKNKTVAVVSHGGSISIFLNSIIRSKEFWRHIPGSASLSIVECKNGRARVKLFNDIKHLNTRDVFRAKAKGVPTG